MSKELECGRTLHINYQFVEATMSSLDIVKSAIQAVCSDAAGLVGSLRVDSLYGYNIFFDTQSQQLITNLPGFQKAVSAFSESPDVKQQFTHPNYTALRFICNFL